VLGLRPIFPKLLCKVWKGCRVFVGECSGGNRESVSPLVKAILAVTAGGERYRLGDYGAITKVRRENVEGNGMFLPASRTMVGRQGRLEAGARICPPCPWRKMVNVSGFLPC
jgi:hypothetical protein